MKFKYYLRGAGIGVIAATVILSAAFLFQDNMSDAQIIQRALELGMVMEEGSPKTLADVSKQGETKADPESNKNEGQSGIDPDDENIPAGQSDTDTDIIDDTPGQQQPEEPSKPKSEKTDKTDKNSNNNENKNNGDDNNDNSDKQDSGNTVTVTIVGGDVSRTVSAKVFEAGLVDSADEFNDFLGSNNYDNLLQPGTYEIAKGSSFEQIAEILTAR